MNREIKFRAWDTKRNRWCDSFSVNGVGAVDASEGVILMQYTGLKDKNGKEIYEGDVVKWGAGVKETVIFRDAKFCIEGIDSYSIPLLKNDCKDFEIIGNIYENPELLK